MKILVISDNYPAPNHPTNGVFVYNLVQQFAKLGHQVTVIAPVQVVPGKAKKGNVDYGQELAKVYRPKYTSISTKQIWKYNTYLLARKIQVRARSEERRVGKECRTRSSRGQPHNKRSNILAGHSETQA